MAVVARMDGNGSSNSTSSTSPRSNNGNLQLPTSSNGGPPRRPAPAVRLPSCQIQRNWDRGEASTNNSNTSASAAAAAAARRRRAATVASPIREYPPALEHHTTSAGILHPATSRQSQSNRNDDNATTTQQHPEYQLNVTPAPGGDGHIYIVDPNTTALRDGNNEPGNDNDKPQPQGWGAALSRGRKRAATTAAALSRTVTGYTGGGGSSHIANTGRDFGDEEATRRARGNSHASVEIGSNTNPTRGEAYDSQVHDMLDVIDPEVQTVNLLGDIQNAFFIPPNRLFDRTRKLQLTRPPESKESGVGGDATGEGGAAAPPSAPVKYTPPRTEAEQAAADARKAERLAQQQQQQQQAQGETQAGTGAPTIPPIPEVPGEATSEKPQATSSGQTSEGEGEVTSEKPLPSKPLPPSASELEGRVKEPSTAVDTEELILANQKYVKGRYFVLPSKLVDMTDWTDQEKADLDDYVRHLMHNKKEIFRRRMRGFGKYVRTPLGCFVTVYASLLTFWGAAWVLFLIGWLPAGDRQAYFVEICDQILVALFCVTGLGLIPWRIRDTYHAYYIIKYHRKTLKLRQKRGLPKLADDNDLPNDQVYNHDLEIAGHAQDAVLNDDEQALLVKHQTALAKSHTYYRPHETFTHHAFPLSFLIAIIVLCDCHSCFQLALGSATWSISYHHWYKKILTTIVLCFSLSCNITGGICIAVGSRLSRKKEVVEALLRQAITEEALKRKEDAERYRAEKRMRKEKERLEREREKENGGSDGNGNGSGGLIKSGSFPINAVKNAPQKLKLITRRNSSDPGLADRSGYNTRRSSSSARSSLDSPRADHQSSQSQLPLRRAGSERLVDSSFDEQR